MFKRNEVVEADPIELGLEETRDLLDEDIENDHEAKKDWEIENSIQEA